MTVTARKHALLNRISPKVRLLAGLYFLEIAVILSWTLLMDSVLNLISGHWFILLPISYLFSVTILAWLEKSRTGTRGQCPLEALGLAEIGLDGLNPSEWQTLIRLLLTPPLVLLFGLGLIPVPRTGKTILQIVSGTKIVPLDTNMDPRPEKEIFRSRRKALMKVISYTVVSLMVTVVIIFMPPKLSKTGSGERITSIHNLPERERELLASYLEMMSMYPDSLEFHVRLASLYYRNNMEEDLQIELEQIRMLDPNHSILLLEEDLSITMEDLIVEPDSTRDDSVRTLITEDSVPPAVEDTIALDTVITQPDSISLDLRLVASDSISEQVDSTFVADTTETVDSQDTVDSLETVDSMEIDSIPELDSLYLPTAEDSVPEIETPIPPPPDETVTEEIPDISVTEDSTAVVTVDSTESSEGIESDDSPDGIEEIPPSTSQPEPEGL
ncbi:MAG: hypothetical protein K8S15_01320 [Candidatus Aegiribacteria sp.]|nr:hypothetical protein [Candidatus Aegiribacteria sp.]